MSNPKPLAKTTDPTFWPLSDRQTAIQVHCAADAKSLKPLEPCRIAYSVAGERLEVFRVNRSLESGDNWITALLPTARRVFGGDELEGK